MQTFIEPADINFEVINRDLTAEETSNISQHIAAYKVRKQRTLVIAENRRIGLLCFLSATVTIGSLLLYPSL